MFLSVCSTTVWAGASRIFWMVMLWLTSCFLSYAVVSVFVFKSWAGMAFPQSALAREPIKRHAVVQINQSAETPCSFCFIQAAGWHSRASITKIIGSVSNFCRLGLFTNPGFICGEVQRLQPLSDEVLANSLVTIQPRTDSRGAPGQIPVNWMLSPSMRL